MTLSNWWTFVAKMRAMERKAARTRPAWEPTLRSALRRLDEVVGDAANGRAELLAAIDLEMRRADVDPDRRRGEWREECLITLKVGLLTEEERAELRAMADRIAADLATAQV